MNFRELSKLKAGPEWGGVVFLAQLFDEMLYDFTHDTYKPSALSPNLLCSEALGALEQVENGHLERRRLEPILDELRHVITGDEICKELLDFAPDFYLRFSDTEPLESVRTRLSLLSNRFAPSLFLSKTEDQLLEACKDPKSKKRIRELARAWVSTHVCNGVHKSHIEKKVHAFFFSPDTEIETVEDLRTFFALFRGKPTEYEVVFPVSKLFSDISERCSDLNCKLEDARPEQAPDVWNTEGAERFLVVKGIRTADPHSAREAAESRLELLSDLFVLYHHKERLSWNQNALVYRTDNRDTEVIGAPKSPLKKTSDHVPKRASQRLGELLTKLSLRDSKAANKFASIVRLHGTAMEAEGPQTQLVNLWTALEVTIPGGRGSKLRAVADTLLPYLLCGYVDSLFYDLAGDLWRWKRKRFSKVIAEAGLPAKMKLHHKVAVILLGKTHLDSQRKLYEMVEGYLLLRFRLFSLQERFSSGPKIKQALESHRTRLTWQISRIYRARNLVVHDGSHPTIIDALAENAHSYLDGFINKVISLSMDDGRVQSIDEASTLMEERFARWWSALDALTDIDAANISFVISGERF